MKQALFRHSILSILVGIFIFLVSKNYPPLASLEIYLWISFLFLNALFFVLYRLIFMTLQTQSQSAFMPLFALTFGLKFFGTLAFMLYLIFVDKITNKAFILLFFGMYLSYTFLWMYAVWQKSGQKTEN